MVDIAQRYFDQHSPNRWKVSGHTAYTGPAMITTEPELHQAAHNLNNAATHKLAQHYDALIISAFGDPALNELRQSLSVPVVGIGESSIRLALNANCRFGIATTTPNLVSSIHKQVTSAGAAHLFSGLRLSNQPPLTLAKQPQAQTAALQQAATLCIEEDGAELVIIAGGPLSQAAEQLKNHFPNTVIVNPVQAACEYLLHRQ